MKRLAASIIIVAALTATGAAHAQDLFGINWEMSIGTGNTNDFIDRYSFRGMSIDYRQFLDQQTALGFQVAWNVLNKKTTEVFEQSDGSGALAGTQFRYQNSFPFLFTAQYHLGKRGKARPYVGAGVGTYRIENRVEVGLLAVEERNWHFGVAPEFGVLLPLSYDSQWRLSARWNNAFKSGDVEHQSYWSFQIGVGSDTGGF